MSGKRRKSPSHLRLVAIAGQRIASQPTPERPERPMAVSFTGLTEAQQQAALAAFPGGRRFRLLRAAG